MVNVHLIGTIDKDIYKCIAEEITTDEVIITEERIAHIKERHPEFKNSIITFMKINEKEWNRLIRNKRILYKKK